MGSFRIKGGIKIRDNIYIRWQTLLCRDLALIVQKAPGMLIVLHCNKFSRQTARKGALLHKALGWDSGNLVQFLVLPDSLDALGQVTSAPVSEQEEDADIPHRLRCR